MQNKIWVHDIMFLSASEINNNSHEVDNDLH